MELQSQKRITFNKLLENEQIGNELKSETGKLDKWSPSIFSKWQERIITIEDKVLTWSTKSGVQGSINFDLYGVSIEKVHD